MEFISHSEAETEALGVCLAAQSKTPTGAEDLLPVYLRLSQAERERQSRMNEA